VSAAIWRQGQNLNFAVTARDLQAVIGSPPGEIPFPGAARQANTRRDSTDAAPQDDGPRPLRPGEPLQGTLGGAQSVRLESGRLVDFFAIEGRAGETVSIFARSTHLDTVLYLFFLPEYGSGLQNLAEDDDGLGGTNSLIVHRLPRNGRYIIGVTTFDSDEAGGYEVGYVAGDLREALQARQQLDPRWLQVGSNAGFQLYVDRESILRPEAGVLRAWVRIRFATMQEDAFGPFNEVMSQEDFVCARRLNRTWGAVFYRDGRLIHEITEPAAWSSIVPGSIWEDTGKIVCGLTR
jgi:hypothetical protein